MQNLLRTLQTLLQEKKPPYTQLSNQILSTTSPISYENVNTSSQITNLESRSNPISVLSHSDEVNIEFPLHKLSRLLKSGYKPDGYDLVRLVRASTDLGLNSLPLQLHNYTIKSGYTSNAFVSTNLIGFYKKIASLSDAHKVFDEITQPTVVSFNSLMSGYVQLGKYHRALSLFIKLDRSPIYADPYSFTTALAACCQLGLLQIGQSIQSKIFKSGLEFHTAVGNCLVDMYGKFCLVEDAIRVFNEMDCKDIISWNSVIAATAINGNIERASDFFFEMPGPDTISYNELINGIAQFGVIEDAIGILRSMPNPNSSTWNSILTGYVNQNRAREALEFFNRMVSKDVSMDEYTFSIILSGISGLSALTWGILIHCCVIKQGLCTSIVVVSALIDMYMKCGEVKNAESLFQSQQQKNLVTWNAMITGYSHNGDSTKVIELFEKMKTLRDLKPDWITFLNVLSACSHCNIPFHMAVESFETMINDYGIKPRVQHCCSMIRLMGQRGEVWRAKKLIYELGFESCGVLWRALLSACGLCRDLKVAKISAAKVIILEGDDDYVYVAMSNLFASHGKWGDVSVMRKLMWSRGLQKEAGCSWIELEKVTPSSSIVGGDIIGLS